MSSIVDRMRPRMLTIGQAYEQVSQLEPMSTRLVSSLDKVSFRFDETWNQGLADKDDMDTIDAWVTVNGNEYQLTKEGLYQACVQFQLPKAYVTKQIDGAHLEMLLNYHYSDGLLDRQVKFIIVDHVIAGVARHSLELFSTHRLLEDLVDSLYRYYGKDTELLVDPRIQVSMSSSDIRVVIPEVTRAIRYGDMQDVPDGETDYWSPGVSLANGYTGRKMLRVEPFMYRWWGSAGLIFDVGDDGHWNRRSMGNNIDEVYVWMRIAISEFKEDFEERLAGIQQLVRADVGGSRTSNALRELFQEASVPSGIRNRIQEILIGSDKLSMYTVMNALISVTNDPEMKPNHVEALYRTAGHMPTMVFDNEKAQVWEEGHKAPDTDENPYAIVIPGQDD